MRFWTIGFLSLALSGCLSEGKLGEATFDYECVANSDTGCDLFGGFPEAMAVGSRFSVIARRAGTGAPLQAAPAASSKLTLETGQFVVQDDGRMSILALEGATVVDIFDLTAFEVAELEIKPDFVQGSFIPPLSFSLSSAPTSVTASPFASTGTLLGGALDYSWEVSPTGVVEVSASAGDNVATITPIAAGQATVTVKQGTVEGTLEVVVEAM